MMKPGHRNNRLPHESAATNVIEYIMITGVLMVLFIVVLLLVNTNIMDDPANGLIYNSVTIARRPKTHRSK